jgi:hypothetical protein
MARQYPITTVHHHHHHLINTRPLFLVVVWVLVGVVIVAAIPVDSKAREEEM